MEKLIYEAKPYFYLMVAAISLYLGKGSTLLTMSGVLIGLSGIAVLMLRRDGRNDVNQINRKLQTKPHDGQMHMGQKTYHI